MKEIVMGVDDRRAFQQAFDYAKDWCKQHQWQIGAAEMALGAAVIAWGVQNGTIEMGKDIVGTAISHSNLSEILGGSGLVAGGIAGYVLGAIGITGMGGAIGIPVALVIGGGSLVLGSLGYTTSDLITKFLNPPIDVGQFFTNASIMAVGVALLVDGARRIIDDECVLAMASRVKDGIIYLTQLAVQVVASTMSELQELMQELVKKPDSPVDVVGSVTAATAVAAGGAAIGTSLAAGTVTICGSHLLGTAALALGLVSAPVWPVIAAGAAGLGIGYTAWKTAKFFGTKTRKCTSR